MKTFSFSSEFGWSPTHHPNRIPFVPEAQVSSPCGSRNGVLHSLESLVGESYPQRAPGFVFFVERFLFPKHSRYPIRIRERDPARCPPHWQNDSRRSGSSIPIPKAVRGTFGWLCVTAFQFGPKLLLPEPFEVRKSLTHSFRFLAVVSAEAYRRNTDHSYFSYPRVPEQHWCRDTQEAICRI